MNSSIQVNIVAVKSDQAFAFIGNELTEILKASAARSQRFFLNAVHQNIKYNDHVNTSFTWIAFIIIPKHKDSINIKDKNCKKLRRYVNGRLLAARFWRSRPFFFKTWSNIVPLAVPEKNPAADKPGTCKKHNKS